MPVLDLRVVEQMRQALRFMLVTNHSSSAVLTPDVPGLHRLSLHSVKGHINVISSCSQSYRHCIGDFAPALPTHSLFRPRPRKMSAASATAPAGDVPTLSSLDERKQEIGTMYEGYKAGFPEVTLAQDQMRRKPRSRRPHCAQ